MASTYKVLGQVSPATTSNTDLYTVPAATSAVVSTLAICNVSSVSTTFRIFVRVGGASATIVNALVLDAYVSAYDTTMMTIGITLAAGDIITVQSGAANGLTFHAFGSEVA